MLPNPSRLPPPSLVHYHHECQFVSHTNSLLWTLPFVCRSRLSEAVETRSCISTSPSQTSWDFNVFIITPKERHQCTVHSKMLLMPDFDLRGEQRGEGTCCFFMRCNSINCHGTFRVLYLQLFVECRLSIHSIRLFKLHSEFGIRYSRCFFNVWNWGKQKLISFFQHRKQ